MPTVAPFLLPLLGRQILQFAEVTPITDSADLLDLKSIIESSYTDGVTAIKNAGVNDLGEIVGIFQDAVSPRLTKQYRFTVTDNDISYQLINPNDVASFADVVAFSLSEWENFAVAAKSATKKKTCTKGTACGGSCISAGKQCRKTSDAGTVAKTKALKEKVTGAKKTTTKEGTKAASAKTNTTKPAEAKTAAAKKTTEKAPDDGDKTKVKTDIPASLTNVQVSKVQKFVMDGDIKPATNLFDESAAIASGKAVEKELEKRRNITKKDGSGDLDDVHAALYRATYPDRIKNGYKLNSSEMGEQLLWYKDAESKNWIKGNSPIGTITPELNEHIRKAFGYNISESLQKYSPQELAAVVKSKDGETLRKFLDVAGSARPPLIETSSTAAKKTTEKAVDNGGKTKKPKAEAKAKTIVQVKTDYEDSTKPVIALRNGTQEERSEYATRVGGSIDRFEAVKRADTKGTQWKNDPRYQAETIEGALGRVTNEPAGNDAITKFYKNALTLTEKAYEDVTPDGKKYWVNDPYIGFKQKFGGKGIDQKKVDTFAKRSKTHERIVNDLIKYVEL